MVLLQVREGGEEGIEGIEDESRERGICDGCSTYILIVPEPSASGWYGVILTLANETSFCFVAHVKHVSNISRTRCLCQKKKKKKKDKHTFLKITKENT